MAEIELEAIAIRTALENVSPDPALFATAWALWAERMSFQQVDITLTALRHPACPIDILARAATVWKRVRTDLLDTAHTLLSLTALSNPSFPDPQRAFLADAYRTHVSLATLEETPLPHLAWPNVPAARAEEWIAAVIKHPGTPQAILTALVDYWLPPTLHAEWQELTGREAPRTPTPTIRYRGLLFSLIRHEHLATSDLLRLWDAARSTMWASILLELARREDTPADVLIQAARSDYSHIREAAQHNPRTPENERVLAALRR